MCLEYIKKSCKKTKKSVKDQLEKLNSKQRYNHIVYIKEPWYNDKNAYRHPFYYSSTAFIMEVTGEKKSPHNTLSYFFSLQWQ